MASPPFLHLKGNMFDLNTAILFLFITIPLSIGALYVILNCVDSSYNESKKLDD